MKKNAVKSAKKKKARNLGQSPKTKMKKEATQKPPTSEEIKQSSTVRKGIATKAPTKGIKKKALGLRATESNKYSTKNGMKPLKKKISTPTAKKQPSSKVIRPGLSAETLKKAGIKHVDTPEAKTLTGTAASGLAIPYKDLKGRDVLDGN